MGGPTAYAPPNEDDIDYGSVTLRQAMVKSVNSVYAQEGVDAGLADVRQTAVRLGIPGDVPGMDPANTSMTLGTVTPSAIDLAAVYAALANHGQAQTPWSVLKLEHTGYSDLPRLPDHQATTALDRGTADAVTGVLRDVISARGTGAAALALGRPAAGKTGTTDSNLAAWFAGYTPELATTVSLFRENPKTHAKESLAGTAGLARINGGAFPTDIWTAYMTEALAGTRVQRFDLQPARGNTQPTQAPSQTPTASPGRSTAPSPSPSPTPTTAPTPTTSPSATPSPTPTPTPGPTATVTPGATPTPTRSATAAATTATATGPAAAPPKP